MPARTAKGETQTADAAEFETWKNQGRNSGGNGRVIKTAPAPPPKIRYGRWVEIGQCVSGTVTKVGTDDYNGVERTELTFELDEPTVTIYKDERVTVEAGSELVLTISQDHLVPQIEAINPQPGLWLKITWAGMSGRMYKFRVDYDDSAVANVPGKPIRMGEFPGTPRDEKPPF